MRTYGWEEVTMATETQEVYQYSPFQSLAFEGASVGYQTGCRGLANGEPDQLTARELRFLQLRSEHAVRNNPYAVNARKTNLIKQGSIDVVWKDSKGKTHTFMQDAWDEFTSNPSLDNRGDYKVFQTESNSSWFVQGTSFIRKLIKRTGNSAKVPFKLQQIPASLHAMEVGAIAPDVPGTVVQNGIRFNTEGTPVSYFFHRSYLEQQASLLTGVYQPELYYEIPADELVHSFTREFAGQWLGIPRLAPVLLALYELDDLIGATVQKQKAAQAIALVISQTGQFLNSSPTAVGTSTRNEYVNDGDKKTVTFHTKGSNALYLNQGEQAQLMQSGDIGANWGVLVETELRKVALVSDLLYHELTGETGNMSFSAMIGLLIQSRNRLEYIANFETIPLRERPIALAFQQLASIYNKRAANAVPHFQLPRWRGLDDLADAQSDILELQNGLGLYEDKLAERGLTIEKVIADREVLKEQMTKYGIEFTSANAAPSMQQATKSQQANSNTVAS